MLGFDSPAELQTLHPKLIRGKRRREDPDSQDRYLEGAPKQLC
jgi:hypothetical protein